VAVLVVAYLVADWRDPDARARTLTRVGWIAAAGLAGLAVSLVLYLPVLGYQAHSIRGAAGTGGGAAFEYATNWSLSWPEFGTMWWPTTAGYGRGAYVGQMPFTDYPNYVGLPLLLLALVGLIQRRDRIAWALVAIIVVATLVALGKNFFVYQVFYELLPGFKKFRVPVMVLAIQQLAIILLAARGLDALAAGRPRIPRAVMILVAVVGLLGVMAGTVAAGPVRDAVIGSLESRLPTLPSPMRFASVPYSWGRLRFGSRCSAGAYPWRPESPWSPCSCSSICGVSTNPCCGRRIISRVSGVLRPDWSRYRRRRFSPMPTRSSTTPRTPNSHVGSSPSHPARASCRWAGWSRTIDWPRRAWSVWVVTMRRS
jgi:hypothetical protein